MPQGSSLVHVHVTINSGREDFKLRDFKAWLQKPGSPGPHQNHQNHQKKENK